MLTSPDAPSPLRLQFSFVLTVRIGPTVEIGPTPRGVHRIVPILGGSFEGSEFSARILAGGADWQFIRPDGVIEIEARYTLETQDSVRIGTTNVGLT
jgi:hypothetical protein